MPEIKFTATPELPFDIRHLNYKKGDVVELSESGCYRWIRRGVAEYVTAPEVVEAVAAPVAAEPVVDPVIADVVVETAEAAVIANDVSGEPITADFVDADQPKRRGRKPRAD